MFYVKHHDDQVAMFNAKCQTVVLMNHMKSVLNITSGFDLIQQQADYKTAAPLGLAERGDQTYANTYLAVRGNYILLAVKDDDEGFKEYQVTWKAKAGDEHDKIAAILDARVADEKKKAGGKGKPKK